MRAPVRAAVLAVVAAFTLLAATPAPTQIPPAVLKAMLPKVALHSEFIVAVNKLGQVTKIVSLKPSKDRTYNLQTGGNALQAFIRTPDGKAIPGTYRLTYDYNPKTQLVHRGVALIHAGGVNPNSTGAVNVMLEDVKKRGLRPPTPTPGPERSAEMTPAPQPTGKLGLPSLQQILKTPAP
jgi:hypothetical protein